MSYKGFANKIFSELIDSNPLISSEEKFIEAEGIVKSVNEFMELVQEASKLFYETFNTPEEDHLDIKEEFPGGLVDKIKNGTTVIDETVLHDLRVVTYISTEKPASIGAHRIDEDGIRNIKERLIDVYPDPTYPGYSIARFGKDIEATITFKVWGLKMYDVRKRAKLLRDIIKLQTWFLKHKGLREIVWLSSNEWEEWDGSNIVKVKAEKYFIRFTEITEAREKNIEQVVMETSLNDELKKRDEFFIPE